MTRIIGHPVNTLLGRDIRVRLSEADPDGEVERVEGKVVAVDLLRLSIRIQPPSGSSRWVRIAFIQNVEWLGIPVGQMQVFEEVKS